MDRRSSLGQTWMTVLLIASLWFTNRSNKTSDPSMQELMCVRAVPRLLWRICVNSVEIVALAAGFSTRGNHCARWAYLKMAERVGFDPLNAEPRTALHGLVRTQKTKRLQGFRLPPNLTDVF